MSHFDAIVIGGGLSGLAACVLLEERNLSACLIEARGDLGGRVRSFTDPDGGFAGDAGPSWVWPGYQPTVARWLKRLDLPIFEQYAQGAGLLDYGPQREVEARMLPHQAGSYRLEGGTARLVSAMADQLSRTQLNLNTPVTSIAVDGNGVTVTTSDGTHDAPRVLLALPPRLAARLRWTPALPAALKQDLTSVPTWMASQAKVVLRYDRPFWRDKGLSGRVLSQAGPCGEIHDLCDPGSTQGILFGFLNWPVEMRQLRADALKHAVLDQLTRCFGPEAEAVRGLEIFDWAQEPFTTDALDLEGPFRHPDPPAPASECAMRRARDVCLR
nr:FAD-dependent oxidoreductase [Roseovarius sp. W115]MDV2928960.1 FAD-dependent oxidoreductase [Roseovarius sp. W115]